MEQKSIQEQAESLLNDYKWEKSECEKERANNALSPYMKYWERHVDVAINSYQEALEKGELDSWIKSIQLLKLKYYG